jgi:exodeoxyribonuclease VII small subunit
MSEKKLSYEQARDQLAEIVSQLESGQSSLEESLKLWERGEELARICQEWLDGARAKIESAKKKSSKNGSKKEIENED